ncbi:MAG: lipid II flippase Amj family protein [Candidatus Margulisiibacteriota bacterium]|nr:lipid II flippase Amj family protein [Candidatus Margulisiibacteriota bacterium]
MNPLVLVCVFTALIHLTETLASSMRLAGVRTNQIATSLSFVNASLLVSRMSNMLQAPLLGSMVDMAIINNDAWSLNHAFRVVIFAAFVGNLLGAILLPFMVAVFTKAIYRFEKHASVPRLIISSFHPRNMMEVARCFRLPAKESFMNLSLQGIPKTFLVLNVFMVSIYAIGVLCSLFAGALIPQFRVTATQLSGIVNGIATILFTTMVDPVAAHITDQAARGKRPINDVRAVVFYIVLGRLFGTLILSQMFFLPGAYYIKMVTVFVQRFFQ